MAISSVKYTFQGTTYTLTLNSSTGAYEATITAPSTSSYSQTNHVYGGSVTATDTAGNSVTVDDSDSSLGSSLQIRVKEKVAPTISMTYPTASAYITNSKPTIKWTVTDSGSGIDSSTIALKVDGTAVSGISTTATTNGYTCTYTPTTALSDGSHTVVASVSDNDGNSKTGTTITFTVDTVAPTLTVSTPTNGLVTNSSTLTVSGTTSDATSTPVTLTVNGTTVTVASNGSWSTTVTLSSGSNTITVIAKDAAGKTTTVTRTVTLDTAAPTIKSITLTPNPVDAGATFVISVVVTD